jgi:EmrB/QacA subfamily drug resistance transporter
MTSAQRWTLVAAILGLSVTILDETVVFVALPAIERDLHIGLNGQQWVVNGYLLTLSALLLVGGSLADLFGRRRLFIWGLVGFGAMSLACAVAPSGGWLITFRLLQGLGAALLMPSTLAMVADCFHGEARGAAIGSWAAWGAVAGAIGPLVAGVLIQAVSRRTIFVLGLPIVVAAVWLAARHAEESYGEQRQRPGIDVLGALLGTASLAGLSFSLIQGPQVGWTDITVLIAAAVAVLAGIGFVVQERRSPVPMLPLGLFRERDFSAANGATLALYGIFNGGFFVLTIHLQTALGYTPLAAGAATLPVTLLMIGLASRLGRISGRVGPRSPMTAGLALTGAGFGLLMALQPGDAYAAHVLPGVVVFGLGLALAVPPLTNTAISAVPDQRSGIASGVNDDVARIAALLGVAIFGIVFATSFRHTVAPSTDARTVVARARERPTAAPELKIPERPTAAPELKIPASIRTEVAPKIRHAVHPARRGQSVGGQLKVAGSDRGADVGLVRRLVWAETDISVRAKHLALPEIGGQFDEEGSHRRQYGRFVGDFVGGPVCFRVVAFESVVELQCCGRPAPKCLLRASHQLP